jgi:hypothetical protein
MTMFSVIMLDGRMFCFASVATIRQLLKVFLKDITLQNGQRKRRMKGKGTAKQVADNGAGSGAYKTTI